MDTTIVYGSAPGLAVAGVSVFEALRADPEAAPPYGSVVRLMTGSPQVFYEVRLYAGPPRTEPTVTCGLRVTGGALVVRDGYDLDMPVEHWNTDEVRLPLPDGVYRLAFAYSSPVDREADVALHIAVVPDPDATLVDSVDLDL